MQTKYWGGKIDWAYGVRLGGSGTLVKTSMAFSCKKISLMIN